MRGRTRAATVALGGAALVTWGPAAQAAIVLTATETWEEDHVAVCTYDDVGDVTIEIHQVHDQTYTLKRRGGSESKQYFFSAVEHIDETFTNPDTGRSWTVDVELKEHDTNVVAVDGDVFTVRVMTHFRTTYYDESGRAFDRASGVAREVLQIDTKGTTDPGDDEGSFFDFDFFHGSPGPDFCADARRFTVD